MLASAPRALVKHSKQVSFHEKKCIIITWLKVTSYILKTKILFVELLIIVLRELVSKTHKKIVYKNVYLLV